MRKLILLVIINVFLIAAAQATDFYVDAVGGSDVTGDGSVGNPYKSITHTITKVSSGDAILAQAGTYNAANGETFPLNVPANVSLQSNASPSTDAIIDGESSATNIIVLAETSTLDGFSIMHTGNVTSGTIYSNAPSFILNNTVTCSATSVKAIYLGADADGTQTLGNTIWTGGSASFGFDTVQFVDNLVITANTFEAAYYGVRVGQYGNDFTCTDNLIFNDNAGGTGGFSSLTNGTGNVFSTNEVRGFTTGLNVRVYGAGDVLNVYHNTFVDNTTAMNFSDADPTYNVKNNIIVGAPSLGSYTGRLTGIENVSGATVNSTYNNFWNIATIYDGTISSSNNISSYPRFVDPDNHDYRIYDDSPSATGGEGGGYQGRYPDIGSSSSVRTETWVDAISGNDTTGDGSISTPWKTMTKGLGNTAGSVHANAGTYDTSNNGESFPLTLSQEQELDRYGTGLATIDAESGAANAVELGLVTTLEGFYINGSNTSYYLIQVEDRDCYVLDNILGASGTSGGDLHVLVAADNCTIDGNTIASARQFAIRIQNSGGDRPDDLTITDNTITNSYSSGGYGIFLPPENYKTATNFTCTGNTITTTRYGIYEGNYINGQTIANNKVIGNGSGSYWGIRLRSSSGTNTINNNEVRDFQATTSSYGTAIYTDLGTFTINKNTLVDNRYGLYGDGGTVTIKNCIITGASALGSYLGFNETGIVEAGATITSTYNTFFNLNNLYSGTIGDKTQDGTAYPRFYDPSAHDFRLFSDSPCVGTADDAGDRGAYGSVGTASAIRDESWVDAVSGNDTSGDGSSGSPWKTITRTLPSTESIVHVNAGTYDTSNGETFPITLAQNQYLKSEASPSTNAIIDTTNARVVGMGIDSTTEGFTIRTSGFNTLDGAIYLMGEGDVLTNTVTCSAASSRGIFLLYYADDSRLIGNNVWMGNSSCYSIYGGSTSGDHLTNLLVSGNTIYAGTSSRGIVADDYSENLLVQANTIEVGTNGYGVHVDRYSDGFNVNNNLLICSGTGSSRGVYAYLVYNGEVSTNEVRGFQYGLYLRTSGTRTITANKNTIIKSEDYGIYCYGSGSTFNLTNNIVSNKPDGTAPDAGSIGVYENNAGTVSSTYDDVWNNETNWSPSTISGVGTISADPLFLNPATDDYNLTAGSPCDGTGTPETTDMGRYDYTAPVLSVNLRNYDDTSDYTTWAIGTGKALNTEYIMDNTECVLVKNDGNVAEDFSVSGEATNWTLGSSAGADTCVLMGLFNGNSGPSAGDFNTTYDLIGNASVWATTSGGNGYFEGTESGANVASSDSRKLYIYLRTPTSISSSYDETFTITIGCKQH